MGSVFLPLGKLFYAEQIHSDGIAVITDKELENNHEELPRIIPKADSLLTIKRGLFLCVKYADCIPVLLYDPRQQAIAGIHSGRCGTKKNITGKTVAALNTHFAADPADIEAALGPAISARHYPVSKEIFREFVSETGIEQSFPFLDLKKVIRSQLIRAGLKPEKIRDFPFCTYEDVNYFSYRRNNTLKRQIAIIGLLNG